MYKVNDGRDWEIKTSLKNCAVARRGMGERFLHRAEGWDEEAEGQTATDM